MTRSLDVLSKGKMTVKLAAEPEEILQDTNELKALENGKEISEEWLLEQLFIAERAARKGKLVTRDVYVFEMHLRENLEQLAHDIWTGKYKPSRGIAFIVRKPVIREIFAAPFRDRIVHHFLYNMIYDWWDRRFINNSYSCRKGKGAFYGVKMLRKQIIHVSHDYTRPTHIIKLDIQGFFMSISHQKVYERVVWGLNRQFAKNPDLNKLLKYLWKEVIFDDPCEGVSFRGKKSDWKDLPKAKSLFAQPLGVGIVIGNLSSQLLANIFLDLLDRYIMYELGYKAYGRYVDDFYIIVPEENYAQAKRDVFKIEKFLKETLGLTLHPNKRYIQEVNKGVEFLGVVMYKKCVVPSKRFKNSLAQGVAEVGMGYRDVSAICSYLGRLKHMDGKKLTAQVFKYMGWWYNY